MIVSQQNSSRHQTLIPVSTATRTLEPASPASGIAPDPTSGRLVRLVGLPVADLPDGTYDLVVLVKDQTSGDIVEFVRAVRGGPMDAPKNLKEISQYACCGAIMAPAMVHLWRAFYAKL